MLKINHIGFALLVTTIGLVAPAWAGVKAVCTIRPATTATGEAGYRLDFTTTSKRPAQSKVSTEVTDTVAYAERLSESGVCPSVRVLDGRGRVQSTCRVVQYGDAYTAYVGKLDFGTYSGDWGYEEAATLLQNLRGLGGCRRLLEPKLHSTAVGKWQELQGGLALFLGSGPRDNGSKTTGDERGSKHNPASDERVRAAPESDGTSGRLTI